MHGDIGAVLYQRVALAQPRLVLGMHGHAPAAVLEHAPDVLFVGHQQVAGRATHEHLHASAAGQAFELTQLFRILGGGADEEGDVAPDATLSAPPLVGQVFGGQRTGLGVGHLEHRRDAPEGRRGGAGGEILLVLEAGLAEMHLGVDDTGQDVQAAGIEHFGGGAVDSADGRDAASPNGDIRGRDAVRRRRDTPADDEIVRIRPSRCPLTCFVPLARKG